MAKWRLNVHDDYYTPNGGGLPLHYTHLDVPSIRNDHRRSRHWKAALVVDVLLLILVYLLSGAFFKFLATPRFYFPLDDYSYSKPVITEQLPNWMMGLLNWIIPLGFLLICEVFLLGFRWWNIAYTIKAYVEALGINLFVTGFFWAFFPSPRPNFYAVCGVDPSLTSPLEGTELYDESVCRNSPLRITVLNGFPSGHASTAWAAWTYIFLFLTARLKPFDGTGHFWKFLLAVLVPLMVPLWVSITRVVDYHHFVFQVIGGAIIGILSALAAYRLNHVACPWHSEGHISTGMYWKDRRVESTETTVPATECTQIE